LLPIEVPHVSTAQLLWRQSKFKVKKNVQSEKLK